MAADKKWKSNKPSMREWQETTRQKIAAGNLITIAIKAASGELELTNSRAAIVKTLLDRVLPAQTESSIEQVNTTRPDIESLRAAIKASPQLKEALQALLSTPVPVEPMIEPIPERNTSVTH